MKKVFGIFLLFIGLIITNIGFGVMVNTETERNNQFNQAVNEFANDVEMQNSFTRDYEKDIAVAFAFIVVGLLLFIIGIVLTATKTKKQREIEMELKVLKSLSNPS